MMKIWVFLIGLILLVTYMGLSVHFSGEASNPDQFKLGYARPQTEVLRAARPLPAYTRIQADDLDTVRVRFPDTGILTDSVAVVGQITRVTIDAETILTRDMVLALAQDQWLLRVPISFTVSPALGDVVPLLGIDAEAELIEVLTDQATVVGMEGGDAVIAVTQAVSEQAARYSVGDNRLAIIRALP